TARKIVPEDRRGLGGAGSRGSDRGNPRADAHHRRRRGHGLPAGAGARDGAPHPGRATGHNGRRRPPRQSGAAGALRRGRAAILVAQPKGASNMTNKVALVTGAGTGIGKAAALAMLKDGYRVALVGRRKELLDRTAADSGAGERAMVLPADLTKPENVKTVFSK